MPGVLCATIQAASHPCASRPLQLVEGDVLAGCLCVIERRFRGLGLLLSACRAYPLLDVYAQGVGRGYSSQERPERWPGRKLLSREFNTCCMMPIPTGEKFVQYPCLGDSNDEPYRFAAGLTGKKFGGQRTERRRGDSSSRRHMSLKLSARRPAPIDQAAGSMDEVRRWQPSQSGNDSAVAAPNSGH